ncbi:right-handed parallel beta-helix repeat-containing protein [Kurthia zopfii]|uniref:right-handed parallel beta-helix repeat-containing protein n=1 Tax=Kurthia zopfii TaxID=1650 RepID=UPI000F70B312|nr:right-handed parallel beta-helix repeat-containing protein [Kurthia zopfii]VEI08558.1 Uncharacterised protein [Kurthia zopfii]
MKKIIALLFICMAIFAVAGHENTAEAASKKVYKITPSSKPVDPLFLRFSTYNKDTKHYYLLRSYLEKFEKENGGTLVLKKGTYTISNALYVPSNVTIKLENGARLNKGTKTGTSQFKPSTSIFQLVRPSKANKKGAYGKHNGEKNIQFIGSGKATIDMKYFDKGIAIIMGHNQNVKVDNIDFQNISNAHFIEMDASKNVKVTNSSFKNSKDGYASIKEAINLDTPDRTTKGWSQEWSKFDRQANDTVLIEGNTFYNLPRAIGTHKYSEKKLHKKVTIRDNKMSKIKRDYIRGLNWSQPVIENNTFSMTKAESNKEENALLRGVFLSGSYKPTIRENNFNYIPRPIAFLKWQNTNGGTTKFIYSHITKGNKADFLTNHISNAMFQKILINGYDNGESDELDQVEFPESILKPELREEE